MKCPEDLQSTSETAITSTESEISSQKVETTTERRPIVIMKQPEKMLDDIFNIHSVNSINDLNAINVMDAIKSINDEETEMQINSNRLEVPSAKQTNQKLDVDEFMQGDAPAVDTDKLNQKKPEISEKKDLYPKKQKLNKKLAKAKDMEMAASSHDDVMMGDQPMNDQPTEHVETSKNEELTTLTATTDRQRRDSSSMEHSSSEPSNTASPVTEELTTIVEVTTQLETTIAPELLTTKHIVAGNPTHLSQAIFKETVYENSTSENFNPHIVAGNPTHLSKGVFKESIYESTTPNNTHRKDIATNDDHFIPPMLLVKTRFVSTSKGPHVETTETETTTDLASSSSAMPDETTLSGEASSGSPIEDVNNKLEELNVSTTQKSVEEVQTADSLGNNQIMIAKRTDSKVPLRATSIPSSVEQKTVESHTTTEEILTTPKELQTTVKVDQTTMTEEPTTIVPVEAIPEKSPIEPTHTEVVKSEAIKVVEQPKTTEEIPTTILIQTTHSETTEAAATQEVPSTASPKMAEKIVEISAAHTVTEGTKLPTTLTSLPINQINTEVSSTPANKMNKVEVISTTLAPHLVGDEKMENTEDNSLTGHHVDTMHELHESHEAHSHEDERENNNFSNSEDDYQRFKPNRHRKLQKDDHHNHHGSYIKKVLG